MKKEDYLKCIISIINFNILYNDEYEEFKSFNIPSITSMMKVLNKYCYDMVSVTEHLSNEKLWENSPKEFFSHPLFCEN